MSLNKLTLHGITIQQSEFCSVPKMQLLPKTVAVLPPEFAAEINQWMREFFGCDEKMFAIMDPISGQQVIVTSKTGLEQLKARMATAELKYGCDQSNIALLRGGPQRCFWRTGCSDSRSCRQHGRCLAMDQIDAKY